MPYKCSICNDTITEEQVTKTVEKFGKALCNKCILDSVDEGAPGAPDTEPTQNNKGEANVAPMVPAPMSVGQDVAIQDLDITTIKKYINPKVTDQEAYYVLLS